MEVVKATTWDEVWIEANKSGGTHYNYTKGKSRFRAVLEDPEEVGTPTVFPPYETIRIRFYTETDETYIENDELEVCLTLSPEYILDLPGNFAGLPPADRVQHLLGQMHKFSAQRWQRQSEAAEKVIWGHIEFLQRLIEKKDKLIAELTKKVDQLQSEQKGISSIYDFLVHPNSERSLELIARLVGSGAIKTAGTEDRRDSELADPLLRKLVSEMLTNPALLEKLAAGVKSQDK